ncbi:hypothetical protein PSN_3928 [Pseudomonas sp. NGC7]
MLGPLGGPFDQPDASARPFNKRCQLPNAAALPTLVAFSSQ